MYGCSDLWVAFIRDNLVKFGFKLDTEFSFKMHAGETAIILSKLEVEFLKFLIIYIVCYLLIQVKFGWILSKFTCSLRKIGYIFSK